MTRPDARQSYNELPTMQSVEDIRYDVSLLKRIVAQEAEAVGELYDRHSSLLYGLILRILRNASEAEEVLQDVFLQVWKRAETFNADLGTPVAWLVRIARNRAIDRLRKNTVNLRTLEVPPPLPSESPETRAALSEEQRALGRALEALSAEERKLLEHAYFLGLTQSELAERFGLPLGTVKTRIRTALSTLRRELQLMMSDAGGYRV
jgi:RNA polymerase sigma-70 factor (ECF subfamily)